MNRQRFIENLIYLFLTYVQAFTWSPSLLASPNLNPTQQTEGSTSVEQQPETSLNLESMNIVNAEAKPRASEGFDLLLSVKDQFSFIVGAYQGPYLDEKTFLVYTYGLDYQIPESPSDRLHMGFVLGAKGEPNPILYLNREVYLRNVWKYLKSWNYGAQLEVDTGQALGSFFSLSHYSAGCGVSFSLSTRWSMTLNAHFLSTRGLSTHIQFGYLL
jgi:hypothetical protein